MLARLLRGSGVAFLLSILGTLVNYLTTVYLTNVLGTADYGLYAYAMTWISLLSVSATLGFNLAVVRLIPLYISSKAWDALKGIINHSSRITLIASIILTIIVASLVIIIPINQTFRFLLVGLWLVPIFSLMELQLGILRAQGEITFALAPKQLIRFLMISLLIFTLVVFGRKIDAVVALLIHGLVVGGLVLIQRLRISHLLRRIARAARERHLTRKWLRLSLPLLLTAGAIILLSNTDIIMLGLFKTTEDVAVYYVAAKIASSVSFPLAAVNMIAAPLVSEAYLNGGRSEIQRLATRIARMSFWPALGAVLILATFSNQILSLFGTEFVRAKLILIILMVGYLINSGAGTVGTFLDMTGHQDSTAFVFGISAILNIILNSFMIPLLGAVGAALSTASIMIIWSVWLHVLVTKHLQINTTILSRPSTGSLK